MTATNTSSSALTGALAAIGAFTIWGVCSLYFNAVSEAPPLEILSHRILWSVVLTLGVVVAMRRTSHLLAVFRSPRSFFFLCASALLIALNWAIFIWAVVNGKALEASIGYYIMPLVMLAQGRMFLGEALRKRQLFAIAIVGLGVVNEVIAFGDVPWIALILAFSFGAYGLIRKIAPVDAICGLSAECIVLAPLAMGYVAYQGLQGGLVFLHHSAQLDALLIAAGLVTTLPLLLFVIAARRLKLGTVGLLQYMNPTLQAFTAVFFLRESFGSAKLVTFGLIWTGLVFFTLEGRLHQRRMSTVG